MSEVSMESRVLFLLENEDGQENLSYGKAFPAHRS